MASIEDGVGPVYERLFGGGVRRGLGPRRWAARRLVRRVSTPVYFERPSMRPSTRPSTRPSMRPSIRPAAGWPSAPLLFNALRQHDAQLLQVIQFGEEDGVLRFGSRRFGSRWRRCGARRRNRPERVAASRFGDEAWTTSGVWELLELEDGGDEVAVAGERGCRSEWRPRR